MLPHQKQGSDFENIPTDNSYKAYTRTNGYGFTFPVRISLFFPWCFERLQQHRVFQSSLSGWQWVGYVSCHWWTPGLAWAVGGDWPGDGPGRCCSQCLSERFWFHQKAAVWAATEVDCQLGRSGQAPSEVGGFQGGHSCSISRWHPSEGWWAAPYGTFRGKGGGCEEGGGFQARGCWATCRGAGAADRGCAGLGRGRGWNGGPASKTRSWSCAGVGWPASRRPSGRAFPSVGLVVWVKSSSWSLWPPRLRKMMSPTSWSGPFWLGIQRMRLCLLWKASGQSSSPSWGTAREWPRCMPPRACWM